MSVTLLSHPFVSENIAILRDKNTEPHLFREAMSRLSEFLAYESLRELPVVEESVSTVFTDTTAQRIYHNKIVIYPVLRAALSMCDSFLKLLPFAEVSHLGFYRDHESLKPVPYYSHISKNIKESRNIILDPMLATGGSAIAAVNLLLKSGAPLSSITFCSVIASKHGVEALTAKFPNIKLFITALDPELNSSGYIVPGLGDAGDRVFNSI